VDLGYLRLEGLVAQTPDARRPATAGVSHVLGAILTPAPVSTLQIGQAPNSSFLVSTYRQINGTGAPLTLRSDRQADCALQDRVGSSQLSDLFVQLLDPLCLVSGGAGPGALVDLGLLDPGAQSLGVDTQLVGDPADRALGPRRVSQCLQRHPRGSLAQLIGVLP